VGKLCFYGNAEKIPTQCAPILRRRRKEGKKGNELLKMSGQGIKNSPKTSILWKSIMKRPSRVNVKKKKFIERVLRSFGPLENRSPQSGSYPDKKEHAGKNEKGRSKGD